MDGHQGRRVYIRRILDFYLASLARNGGKGTWQLGFVGAEGLGLEYIGWRRRCQRVTGCVLNENERELLVVCKGGRDRHLSGPQAPARFGGGACRTQRTQ